MISQKKKKKILNPPPFFIFFFFFWKLNCGTLFSGLNIEFPEHLMKNGVIAEMFSEELGLVMEIPISFENIVLEAFEQVNTKRM